MQTLHRYLNQSNVYCFKLLGFVSVEHSCGNKSLIHCTCLKCLLVHKMLSVPIISFFLILYSFLARGKGRDKEREKKKLMCERDIDQLPLTCPQPGGWPSTQAACSGWESNWRPVGLGVMPTRQSHIGQSVPIISCNIKTVLR